jgi:hypothetical protein
MKLLWRLATIACVSSLSAYALAQGMGPPGGGPQGQGPAAMGQPGGNPAGPGAVGQSAPPGAGRPGNGHRAGRGEHAGDQPFNPGRWRGGHWWHGSHGARPGWWWVVGPNWYWYPTPIYPYPDFYIPAGMSGDFWYWCDAYQQYYPYVGACPSGWRAVPAY